MAAFYSLVNFALLFFYWLVIAIVTICILLKRRSVPSTLAWLLMIYIIPLIGVIAYLAFGELHLHLGKRKIIQAKNMWPSVSTWLRKLKKSEQAEYIFCKNNSRIAEPLFELCEKRQGIGGVKINKIAILNNYQDSLNTILSDINSAYLNIEMVFYIWQSGGLVDQITEALIKAAKRGIKCRIMIDSAGSWSFFHSPQPQKMREAGIELIESLKVTCFRCFLRRIDLRQHRKIIIIDNNISYVGSMNMVDPRFYKQTARVGQWIDILVRMEGPVSIILGIVYAFDWEMETGQRRLPFVMPIDTTTKHKQFSGHNMITQVIASGPGFPEELIQQSLLTAIFSARKQLILTTPYFVPSEDLIHAICTAAMRGVEVLIIIPNRNNSFLVSWASRDFYSELLESGVKIYQFNNGLLHTKSVSVDGELSLIGSVNLDIRSLLLNFEITVVIDDKSFCRDLVSVQYDYIANSTPLILNHWNKRPLWNRIIERICYFFSPLL